MSKLPLTALVLVVLAVAGCGPDRVGAQPTPEHPGGRTSPATPVPMPPGWQIHINQYAQFAVQHPPGWTVHERHGPGRSLELSLTPPRGGGVVLRRQFDQPSVQRDLPNTRCRQIRISQLPGIRCEDTTAGTIVAVLTGTGQGHFVFQASRRSPGYAIFDQLVATFQLIRGA